MKLKTSQAKSANLSPTSATLLYSYTLKLISSQLSSQYPVLSWSEIYLKDMVLVSCSNTFCCLSVLDAVFLIQICILKLQLSYPDLLWIWKNKDSVSSVIVYIIQKRDQWRNTGPSSLWLCSSVLHLPAFKPFLVGLCCPTSVSGSTQSLCQGQNRKTGIACSSPYIKTLSHPLAYSCLRTSLNTLSDILQVTSATGKVLRTV